MNEDHILEQGIETNDKLEELVSISETNIQVTSDIVTELKDLNNSIEQIILQEDDNNIKPLIETQIEKSIENTKEIVNAIKEQEDKIDIQIDGSDTVFYKGEKGDKGEIGVIDEVKFTETVDKVISTIKGIKPTELQKIEDLLTNIYNKEDKEVDLTELKDISYTLKKILKEVSKEVETNDDEILQPDLLKIQNLLETLNKSIKGIKFKDPESFDYEKFAKSIQDNIQLNFTGGGSSGSVELRNIAQQQINPATEDGNLASINIKMTDGTQRVVTDFFGTALTIASEMTVSAIKAKTDNLDVPLSTPNKIQAYNPETLAYEEIRAVDNCLFTIDYLKAIGLGLVPGHSIITIKGKNPDVDNVREDVWEVGGTYVFPSDVGISMKIVSSSASDASAGTGARTVDVNYLRAGFIPATQRVTLNGTTPVVLTDTDIIRINGLHVMTVGSNGVPVGNLSLVDNATGTITYGYISVGLNASRQCVYTVPAGKTLFITRWDVHEGASSGSHFTEILLRSTTSEDGELTPGVFHIRSEVSGDNFIKCVAQSDVKISAMSDAANANVGCNAQINGWLE